MLERGKKKWGSWISTMCASIFMERWKGKLKMKTLMLRHVFVNFMIFIFKIMLLSFISKIIRHEVKEILNRSKKILRFIFKNLLLNFFIIFALRILHLDE